MPPVEIQWCDHSSVLLEYLRQLYEEGRFVDVGLECEGRQVKAHKAVISACSPYLEGLLKGNPAKSHLIKFNGYSYTSLRSVIDFMYNGKVMVEQDNLAAFLKLGRALQVRGILDIAAQCEEAGLTTPEETRTNAQYSTTVQQNRNQNKQNAESKKYAFMLDKNQHSKKNVRKTAAGIIGSVDHQQATANNKMSNQIAQQQQQQQQQVLPQQTQQQAQETTLEELQQALASGQAILQTAETTGAGDQTLQMVEGQCVVTGSGQTYVVVQDGDNLSFVPAEMVQGDLQSAVNGGQVMETLDNVEQQLAQMEGQVLESTQVAANIPTTQTTSDETGSSLDTMSVVESLVKLGQKQPMESEQQIPTEETPEAGPDMPCLGSDDTDSKPQVGPDMPDLGGVDPEEEERAVDEPDPVNVQEPVPGQESVTDHDSRGDEAVAGGVKRKVEGTAGGRNKKAKM